MKIGEAGSFPPFEIHKAFAGTIVYPPGGQLGPRMQYDLQLVLLHSGQINLSIDAVEYDIVPGHIVLLKPGHSEKFIFAKGEEIWHRWITLSVAEGSQEDASLRDLPLFLPISEEMNRFTDHMIALKHRSGQENAALLNALGLAAFLLYISEATRQEKMKSMHPAVLLAKSTIHKHFQEDLTLQEQAQTAQVSSKHLIRLFYTHVWCHNY